MNYYPRHVGDYLRDASHLSLLEHGVYVRLMDVYYVREAPIQDDQKYRVVSARTEEEQAAVDAVLAEFFVLNDGFWTQVRCDREIEAAAHRAEKARENGRAGGRPRTQAVPAGIPAGTKQVSVENPAETQRVISGFPNKTQEKASQKPKAKEQPISPPTGVSLSAENGGGDSEAHGPPPPWWNGWTANLDHLSCELVASIRSAKGYPGFDPTYEETITLVDWMRRFAPDDEVIRNLVVSFVERADRRASKKPEYVNPLAALRKWATSDEARWRQLRRERERDARSNFGNRPAPAPGTPSNRPREGVEFWIDGSTDPATYRAMVNGVRTEEPFDREEWLEARQARGAA